VVQNKKGELSMKKLIVMLMVVGLMFVGCNKPPAVTPPDTGTETTITESTSSKLLQVALNTGCSIGKVYVAVDNYLPFVKPFVPANIMEQAVPILNTFHSALNLYMAAVITWSDTKTAPTDFDQLKTNLLKVKDEAMPIIQQILALINKPKEPKALLAEGNVKVAITQEKAMFTCDITEFKSLTTKIKELPVIS
jgi:hypothetical protein